MLGCTHYETIADLFRAALPPGTPLIHQPAATADAVQRYLARHPEYVRATPAPAASSPPAARGRRRSGQAVLGEGLGFGGA